MANPGWYLIAYDIADPLRLKRVHRLIKKHGIAAQQSLFFFRGTEARTEELLDEIAALMHLKQDDLRAYPIRNPAGVWTFGINPLAAFPLVVNGSALPAEENPKPQPRRKFWKRILGTEKEEAGAASNQRSR